LLANRTAIGATTIVGIARKDRRPKIVEEESCTLSKFIFSQFSIAYADTGAAERQQRRVSQICELFAGPATRVGSPIKYAAHRTK